MEYAPIIQLIELASQLVLKPSCVCAGGGRSAWPRLALSLAFPVAFCGGPVR